MEKKLSDKYEFGKCNVCNKDKALKNGVCFECKNSEELSKFFKDLFNK